LAWKKIDLPDNIHNFDFVKLSKNESDPKTRVRLLAMAGLQDGMSAVKIAASLKVCSPTISSWLKRFKEEGLQGLYDKPKTGRKSKFPLEKSYALKNEIKEINKNLKGGRLTGKDIQRLLKEKYSINYNLSSVYNLLHNIGMSWVLCRS
jgi:transposase